MPDLSTKSVYRILMPAGIVIIPAGIASSVYTLSPVDVPLNGALRHGLTDTLTPDMGDGKRYSEWIYLQHSYHRSQQTNH
jgi:hypothetical protein